MLFVSIKLASKLRSLELLVLLNEWSHSKKIGRDEGDGSRTETQGSFDQKYGRGVGEASKERKTILQNQGNKERDLEQGRRQQGGSKL